MKVRVRVTNGHLSEWETRSGLESPVCDEKNGDVLLQSVGKCQVC